jgi:hypothetical protein
MPHWGHGPTRDVAGLARPIVQEKARVEEPCRDGTLRIA